jgi:DNA-directed RNA polymerase subunit M/transcription elongation factor TFIIS
MDEDCDYSVAADHPRCPKCNVEGYLIRAQPALEADGEEQAFYECGTCGFQFEGKLPSTGPDR